MPQHSFFGRIKDNIFFFEIYWPLIETKLHQFSKFVLIVMQCCKQRHCSSPLIHSFLVPALCWKFKCTCSTQCAKVFQAYYGFYVSAAGRFSLKAYIFLVSLESLQHYSGAFHGKLFPFPFSSTSILDSCLLLSHHV